MQAAKQTPRTKRSRNCVAIVLHLTIGWLVPLTVCIPGKRAWALLQYALLLLAVGTTAVLYYYYYGQFLGYGCLLRRNFTWAECTQTCAQLHEPVPAFYPFQDATVATFVAIGASAAWLLVWVGTTTTLSATDSTADAESARQESKALERVGANAAAYRVLTNRATTRYATANALWWYGGACFTGLHLLYVRSLRPLFVIHFLAIAAVVTGCVLYVTHTPDATAVLATAVIVQAVFAVFTAPLLRVACVIDIAHQARTTQQAPDALLVASGARSGADIAVARQALQHQATIVANTQRLTHAADHAS